MKVAIFGKTFSKGFEKYIFELFQKLKEIKSEIIVYRPFYEFLSENIYYEPRISDFFLTYDDLISQKPEFLFSIGGDGTFLEAISYVRDSGIPLVGFNSGRLGFLADISKEIISDAIEDIKENKYIIEKRSLIQIIKPANLFNGLNFGLNEITVHKKDSSSMITIHAYINEEYLNTYWADGLIISTPTGSTAYSMSAGGPIVVPDSNNFIIAPLASHNLTVRPIIISDKTEITLKVESRSANYLVSIDSRSEVFEATSEIKLKKASFYLNVLKISNYSFFNTLRNKLMWGADKRN